MDAMSIYAAGAQLARGVICGCGTLEIPVTSARCPGKTELLRAAMEADPRTAFMISGLNLHCKPNYPGLLLKVEVQYRGGRPPVNAIKVISALSEIANAMQTAAAMHLTRIYCAVPQKMLTDATALFNRLAYAPFIKNNFVNSTQMETLGFQNCPYMGVTIALEYSKSALECQWRKSQVRDILDELTPAFSTIGDDWVKAYAVMKYCAKWWQYVKADVDGDDVHTAYAALFKQRAVCQGFALAYQQIMNRLGIPCMYVFGIAHGGGHAWNAVCCGGEWFYVDVTDAVAARSAMAGWNINISNREIDEASERPERTSCRYDKAFVLAHQYRLPRIV